MKKLIVIVIASLMFSNIGFAKTKAQVLEKYEIKIKPMQGKTMIWPAEWTHAHSGEVVKSGKKYIITGHMHYPIRN